MSSHGSISRYDGNGQSWTKVGGGGVTIPAADGTVAVNNDIWMKRTDGNENQWYQIPGEATRIAVMNRNSLYIIGTGGDVYRGNRSGQWVKTGNTVSDIAASADGSVMVIDKTVGTLWRKVGDNAIEAWTQQPFNQGAAAVAIPNVQCTVAVGKDMNIYRW